MDRKTKMFHIQQSKRKPLLPNPQFAVQDRDVILNESEQELRSNHLKDMGCDLAESGDFAVCI